MITPKDFYGLYPWSSVLQNLESEIIVLNIMKILNRTGNTWRELTWEEYKKERLKDFYSGFSAREQFYFNDVIGYCKSPDTTVLFSNVWKKIVIGKK